MNVKGSLRTLGAIAYKNRAWIATGVGMVCVVGGTVSIISKAREAVEVSEDLEIQNTIIRRKDAKDEWESKQERSAARKVMVKTAVKGYTRAYWLGILLQLIGLGLITWSDIEQCKDLSAMSALASGYAATLATIKERVIADQGEEKWQEYLLGPQCTTVDVLSDGSVVQTTEPVDNPNRQANLPPHCYIFDEANPNWEKDPLMNRDFLEDHERWLDQKLDAVEFLFTNDILRDLNMPIVKSGWTSGIMKWRIDPETGDRVRNHVKLGLDAKNPRAQAFRDGVEPSIVLQLNVEDNILDKLKLPVI